MKCWSLVRPEGGKDTSWKRTCDLNHSAETVSSSGSWLNSLLSGLLADVFWGGRLESSSSSPNHQHLDRKWRLEFGFADLNVSRFDASHQDSVTLHKLNKCVSDGITGSPDPDGLHHARVSQLTNAQLSVKQLKKTRTLTFHNRLQNHFN